LFVADLAARPVIVERILQTLSDRIDSLRPETINRLASEVAKRPDIVARVLGAAPHDDAAPLVVAHMVERSLLDRLPPESVDRLVSEIASRPAIFSRQLALAPVSRILGCLPASKTEQLVGEFAVTCCDAVERQMKLAVPRFRHRQEVY